MSAGSRPKSDAGRERQQEREARARARRARPRRGAAFRQGRAPRAPRAGRGRAPAPARRPTPASSRLSTSSPVTRRAREAPRAVRDRHLAPARQRAHHLQVRHVEAGDREDRRPPPPRAAGASRARRASRRGRAARPRARSSRFVSGKLARQPLGRRRRISACACWRLAPGGEPGHEVRLVVAAVGEQLGREGGGNVERDGAAGHPRRRAEVRRQDADHLVRAGGRGGSCGRRSRGPRRSGRATGRPRGSRPLAPPSRSSSGRKARPSIGPTPSTAKKSWPTAWPRSVSGRPPVAQVHLVEVPRGERLERRDAVVGDVGGSDRVARAGRGFDERHQAVRRRGRGTAAARRRPRARRARRSRRSRAPGWRSRRA